MAVDRKQKAKRQVENLLFTFANEGFFMKHFIGLNNTVQGYCTLKKAFKDTHRSLRDYDGFETEFSKFCAIQRFVSDRFKDDYYAAMTELRSETECDIKQLCERLVDRDNEDRVQFSFTTKLLNIMNDEKYPIYDSYVARAFGLNPDSFGKQEKIDNYVACYGVMMEIYSELLPQTKEILTAFRRVILVSQKELSDMRALDIVIWKLGEQLIRKNIAIVKS